MDDQDYKSRLTFSYLMGVQRSTEEGVSTLDGLIPLFAPILQPFAGQIFDPGLIASHFTSVYGAKIHPYAISSISQRLFEAGYLVETGKDRKGNLVVYTISEAIKIDSTIAEDEVDELFLAFRKFAGHQVESHSLPFFEDSELDDAFIERLQSFPLPDPRAWKVSASASKSTITLPRFSKLDDATILAERKIQWLNAIFSDFVLNEVLPGSHQYEIFEKVAAGSIVVEAVLNFSDPKPEKDLKNTWFLIDTPLLMDLLDLDSPQRHIFAVEMFAQLRKANARLGVFSHSLDETSNNIKAALAAYSDRNSHGAIGIRMISDYNFVKRIGLVQQNLKLEIKNLGFTVFESPSSVASLGHLSQDVEHHLSNNIGSYSKDTARLRDSNSIAGVVRLRGTHRSSRQDFSSTKYIFVTRNSRLASLSENFLISQKIYRSDEMPAVVTDSSLAAVLWLMFGSAESSSLPYKRLLANCTAIPQTDQNIRQRVLKLIADDNSELSKSFQIWSRTPRGAEVMLRGSLGDPELITANNLHEFIESVKLAAGSEAAETVRLEMQHQLDAALENQSEINAAHEGEKSVLRSTLQENTLELNSVKLLLEKNTRESSALIGKISADIDTLKSDLYKAAVQRELDRERILQALVGKLPAIQRKWDIILGVSAGCLAASLAISTYIFDKHFTVSDFWDPIVMYSLFTLTGVLTACVYGPIPNFLFQRFINSRKLNFVVSQLMIIGETSLMRTYDFDVVEHRFVKKIGALSLDVKD